MTAGAESVLLTRVPWRRARVCAALVLLSAVAGCNARPEKPFVRQAARLHEQGLQSAVRGFGTGGTGGELQKYVQRVGERLLEGARAAAPDKGRDPLFSRMRFHVVNVDIPNVFTTGGAHVYVYAGLFRDGVCDTEEELAAAMAHAVAHAVNLDVQNTAIRPDEKLPPAGIVWEFVVNRFTAQQEWEADKLAFAAFARGGWDPRAYGNLYTKLSDNPRYALPPAVDRPPLAIRPEAPRVSGVEPSRQWRRLPVADRRKFLELKRQAQWGLANAPAPQPAEIWLRALPNCVLPADLPEQVQAQEQVRPPPPPTPQVEPS